MNPVSPRSSAACRLGARLLLSALVGLTACKESGDSPPPKPPGPTGTESARAELLRATGACVEKTAREFLTTATALADATRQYAAEPTSARQTQARDAFHAAMDVWQRAEVMQVGPAAPRSLPGGAELRDNIYSWPLVSRCAVEEQVVAKGYEAPGFPTSLVSRRGLYAVEYLLFHEGEDTACQATSPIVAQGTWAALSSEERASRKRAYAAAAAADVRERATQLVGAWAADQGNFARTLATAGESGNTVYTSSQTALNSVSDALFYFEREGKDLKLARPLGLRDCSTESCPEHLESQFAHRSKANLRANLEGFRRIAQGCDDAHAGTGFDDLLEAAGAEALATRMTERFDAATASFAAIEEADLKEALAQDKPSVRALYDAVKGITDILKTELVTVLDLELPQSVEGDND
ncbi:imelysin family protein [Myxococcus sp. K15C18031901]|uniref:imelysin family protein n=1 Tax=Myxococcus dinghuensis TaxID=2906761 RepID=UPI0020A7D50A|nr:imelysin family protein [Myxococcus dinghuensis]MCP3100078.1 imelysin family protein [Myxococcus dinghuensis]